MTQGNSFWVSQSGVTVRGNARDVKINATQIVQASQGGGGGSRQVAGLFGGSAINLEAKVSQEEIVTQDHGGCRMLAKEGASS